QPRDRRVHAHHRLGGAADLEVADVGGAGRAPGDAGLGVALVHHVLVDVRRGADLLHEVGAAPAAPLAGPTRVGDEVPPPQEVREDLLVDLGGRLGEVAEAGDRGAPAVDALHGGHPPGGDLAAVVEERPAGAGVLVAPHLAGRAELVDLGAGP